MMSLRSTVVAASLFVLSALPTAAQQDTVEPDPGPDVTTAVEQAGTSDGVQVEELRRRIDLLAAELEQLRSGEASKRFFGQRGSER